MKKVPLARGAAFGPFTTPLSRGVFHSMLTSDRSVWLKRFSASTASGWPGVGRL